MLANVAKCRVVLPDSQGGNLALLGGPADRPFRNQLTARWLAKLCSDWLNKKAEVRRVAGVIPQATLIAGNREGSPERVITGNCAFTTDGLGITPGNQFGLIQCSENAQECALLGSWFSELWNSLPASADGKDSLIARLRDLIEHKAPSLIYFLILFHLFKDLGQELDEDRIVKSATGIRNTNVWKKLFKFQRDGVIGAIDKLERYGGCIIADSVGLGKTFEALAIIKYYELRNDRVLVLVPETAARQLDALQIQRPAQCSRGRPLELRCAQPHRSLPRRRHLGRHRPVARQLGQLRPGGHRRIAQLPEQEDPSEGRRDSLRPPDAADHQGRREDPRAHALGDAGEQPPRRSQEPDRFHHRGR